jgi:acetyl-CoA acetyltransferase/ferredoxin
MIRVHTAGSVGGSTALVAAHLVKSSGIHKRVLTVAYEKQSDSDAMWALSVPQPFAAPLLAGAGGYFAPIIRAYMRRSGAPGLHREDGGGEGPPERHAQSLCPPPPGRHRHEDGEDSMMLWDPLRYLEACPSSDGAAAMVLASEDADSRGRTRRRGSTGRPCGRSRPCSPAATRSTPRPAGTARPTSTPRPGSPSPDGQIDVAEVYVPFSWYEPMWLENLGFCELGDGWKLTESGATAFDGGHPLEHLGRRALVQPHRGIGDAPVPGGGHAGAGPGRGAPGGRGQGWRSARPTAGVPVLLHVGGRERQALNVDYDVCMGIAPEVFEVRDDGFLYVLNEHPGEELREKVRQAANGCPTGAITIVEDE